MFSNSKIYRSKLVALLGVALVAFAVHTEISHAENSCTIIASTPLPRNITTFDDAGDYDVDGVPDILIGGDPTQIVSGRDGSVLLSISTTIISGNTILGPQGRAAHSIADINGDGVRDIVGSAVTSWKSRVDVFDGISGSLLYRLTGVNGASFGIGLDIIGDVNGDGYEDFGVGQSGFIDGAPFPTYGRVIVYSGVDGEIIHSIVGTVESGAFGLNVSGLGDVDSDGVPDFGATTFMLNATDHNTVSVFSGATGGLIYTVTSSMPGQSDYFGISVSSIGDINQDGSPDFIVGAHNDGQIGVYGTGRADVFSGIDGNLLFTLWPDTTLFDPTSVGSREGFGVFVTGGEDLNSDGVPDIVVGANRAFSIAGRAYVFSGADQSTIAVIAGQTGSSGVGRALGIVGDVNGDCIGDLAISESLLMFQNSCGRPASCQAGCCNIPGDANSDNKFNIADVSFSIARIFSGGPAPLCQDEADANGDNMFNIADVTYGIDRIFGGGPMPICGSTAQ